MAGHRGAAHINGIESFWAYAKTRIARFRGMNPATFPLHLKECEFRFNNRGLNLTHILLKICRKIPYSRHDPDLKKNGVLRTFSPLLGLFPLTPLG